MKIYLIILQHQKKGEINQIYLLFYSFLYSGVPQGQAFQRTRTITELKQPPKTTIAWIQDGTNTNYINIKPPGLYKFEKLIYFN